MFDHHHHDEEIEELLKKDLTTDRLIFLTNLKILQQLKNLNHFLRFLHRPIGVAFFINGERLTNMADLILAQGASKNASLHYVDSAGNDLGQVPPKDNPQITADNPVLGLAPQTDGSETLTNANTTTSDVDVNMAGSAGGFNTTAVVTVSGTGVTPPPVPAGVKFVFA